MSSRRRAVDPARVMAGFSPPPTRPPRDRVYLGLKSSLRHEQPQVVSLGFLPGMSPAYRTPTEDQVCDLLSSSLLHLGDGVGISIEGDLDTRMTEPSSNNLRVDSQSERQGRPGMPDSMHPDRGNSGLGGLVLYSPGKPEWAHGASVFLGEHKIEVLPNRTGLQAVCELSLAVSS